MWEFWKFLEDYVVKFVLAEDDLIFFGFWQVRYLNKVAISHALIVAGCNIDLESLITDANRSIATLAITTLLKTGSEGGVDRLLKQIGNFMSDIADEFKIVVVEAIRALCLKFPQVPFYLPEINFFVLTGTYGQLSRYTCNMIK